MRFAVRGSRAGLPRRLPRSHGVPRRDVDGRVHVRGCPARALRRSGLPDVTAASGPAASGSIFSVLGPSAAACNDNDGASLLWRLSQYLFWRTRQDPIAPQGARRGPGPDLNSNDGALLSLGQHRCSIVVVTAGGRGRIQVAGRARGAHGGIRESHAGAGQRPKHGLGGGADWSGTSCATTSAAAPMLHRCGKGERAGPSQAGRGSLGRPRIRSPMMLRWIWLLPP